MNIKTNRPFLLLGLCALCWFMGCAGEFSNAEIEVLSVQKLDEELRGGSPGFKLTMRSTTNIIEIYQEEGAGTLYLTCPCRKKTLERNGGYAYQAAIEDYLFLYDTILVPVEQGGYYTWNVPIAFQDDGGNFLPKEQVEAVLEQEDQIQCEFVMADKAPFSTFRTQPFFLDAAELAEALDQ